MRSRHVIRGGEDRIRIRVRTSRRVSPGTRSGGRRSRRSREQHRTERAGIRSVVVVVKLMRVVMRKVGSERRTMSLVLRRRRMRMKRLRIRVPAATGG